MSDPKDAHRKAIRQLADQQRDNAHLLWFAVDAARADGLTWVQIAECLGVSYPTVLRQHEAGSPIVVVRPYQKRRALASDPCEPSSASA